MTECSGYPVLCHISMEQAGSNKGKQALALHWACKPQMRERALSGWSSPPYANNNNNAWNVNFNNGNVNNNNKNNSNYVRLVRGSESL